MCWTSDESEARARGRYKPRANDERSGHEWRLERLLTTIYLIAAARSKNDAMGVRSILPMDPPCELLLQHSAH